MYLSTDLYSGIYTPTARVFAPAAEAAIVGKIKVAEVPENRYS